MYKMWHDQMIWFTRIALLQLSVRVWLENKITENQ